MMVKKTKKWAMSHFLGRAIKSILLTAFNLILFGIFASSAFAFNYVINDCSNLDIRTTLNYGVAMRTAPQEHNILNQINYDDGDRNFKRWRMTSNLASIQTEIGYRYYNFLQENDELLIFTSGYAFYDQVYHQDNENNSPSTNNAFVGGKISEPDKWDSGVKRVHADDAQLRDYYASYSGHIGERAFMARVGQQVVSWGEALATFGSISAAMSYADATKMNTPGMELKDVFLPTEQALISFDIVKNLSFAGFYQWEWQKNVLDAAGSYFNTSDIYDEGGYFFLAAPDYVFLHRDTHYEDKHWPNRGQWGTSLRYLARGLNDTEFTLVYINYNEKMPIFRVPDGIRPGGRYYLEYPENVQLLGGSFSTNINTPFLGGVNYAGEFTYRKDFPVAVGPSLGSYEDFDVIQTLLSAYISTGPIWFIDNNLVLIEGGFNKVLGAHNLHYQEPLGVDEFACGYLLKWTFVKNGFLPRIDLEVPVTFKHKIQGRSALLGTWSEGQNELGVGLDFTYNLNIKFGVSYVDFLGSRHDAASNSGYNWKCDRDYVAGYVKYTF